MPERAISPKSATGCLLILIPAALTMSALFVAWPIILGATVLFVGGNLWQSNQWMKTMRSIDPVFHQLVVQNRGEITPLDLSLNAQISGAVSSKYLATKANEFGTGNRQHPERGQIYYFVSPSVLGAIFDDSEREVPEIMPAAAPVVAVLPTAGAALAEVAEVTTPIPAAPVETPPVASDLPTVSVQSEPAPEPQPIAKLKPIERSPAPAEASPLSNLARLLDEKDSPQSEAEPTTSNQQEVERPIDPIASAPAANVPIVTILQSDLAKRLDVHSSTIYKRRSDANFTDWTRNRDPEGLGWAYTDDTKEYYRIDT